MTTEPLQQTNEELILAFLADGEDDFISGEALSDKLGLSRTAVWKYVESLRQKGYRIEAIPAREPIKKRLTALWDYEKFGVPFALPAYAFRLERAQAIDGYAISDGYLHYQTVRPQPGATSGT